MKLKNIITTLLLSIVCSIQANAEVTIQTPEDINYKSGEQEIQQIINDKIKQTVWSNDSKIITIYYENEDEEKIINEIITSWECIYYFGLQKTVKGKIVELNIRKINNVDAYIYEVDTIKALNTGKAVPEVPKKIAKHTSNVIKSLQKERKQYIELLRFYNYDFKEAKKNEKNNSKSTSIIFDN